MAYDPKKIKGDLRVEGEIAVPNESAQRALQIDANGKIKSSSVTSTELGHLSGVTSSIQTQINNANTDLSNHLSDTVDAHDASAISNVPAGSIAATDVQAAINELDGDIQGHITDSSDAHDASAISNVPSGNLAATDVQGALNELQSDVDSRIPNSEKGNANGVATLDGSGKVPVSQLPSAVMTYEGVWNASTNSPTLADGVGDAGMVYRVGTAGSQDLGSGSISFSVGDYVIYNGSIWEKSDTTDAVASIFGRTGIVTAQSGDYNASQITNTPAGNIAATDVQAAINELDSEKFASADFNSTFDSRLATKSTSDLSEGTNLYFTDERAQDAVGTILVDSASIDFTYNDGTPSITAAVLPAGVDHDQLSNFVANEHVDHSSVSIATAANTSGLTGGGDLTATRNLSVDINGTTAETSADDADKLLIWDNSANALKSMTRANFLTGVGGSSAGDIEETSFSAANNQASPANVTGFAFANGVVRSFKALVSVHIDATSDLYESFQIHGVQKGADWFITIEAVGDDSGVTFSITSAGQIQYTSTNVSGHVSTDIRFRAWTTSI